MDATIVGRLSTVVAALLLAVVAAVRVRAVGVTVRIGAGARTVGWVASGGKIMRGNVVGVPAVNVGRVLRLGVGRVVVKAGDD